MSKLRKSYYEARISTPENVLMIPPAGGSAGISTSESAIRISQLRAYDQFQQFGGMAVSRQTVLRLSGKDSLDLLQRISTNDVLSLGPGKVVHTVFVTDKARCVAVASLFALADDLMIIAEPVPGINLAAWIDRFVIMEDVQIVDESARFDTVLRLLPENAAHLSSDLLFLEDSNEFAHPLWAGLVTVCLKDLRKSGVDSTMGTPDVIPEQMLETIRIEHGVPRSGYEITESVHPFECGLAALVNLGKGCYIGQEVLARLDTYNKVQKHLTGFLFDSALEIAGGGTLSAWDGKIVGSVTSTCFSPKANRSIGLGFIKTSFANETDRHLLYNNESGGVPIPAVAVDIADFHRALHD